MITVETRDHLVTASVFGEFTLADFQQFEQAVLFQIQFKGRPALLVDLSDMTGATLDVAWEDIRFTREHGGEFSRVAVVTGSRWLVWSAWLNRLFVDSEIQVFEDFNLAQDWAAAAH